MSYDPTHEDDYYAQERRRIAQETRHAREIQEAEINQHLTDQIPYYLDADPEIRRIMLLVNNVLVNRFEETGMVYWSIFQQKPDEIEEYDDYFQNDVSVSQRKILIHFLREKLHQKDEMVDIGFDDADISDGFGVIGESEKGEREEDYGSEE